MQYTTSSQPHPRPWRPEEIENRLAGTHEGWRSWSALHQSYDGPWAELVHHSGRVLQACPDEAEHFLSWIVGAAGTSMQRETGLQIMYGIGGEHDLSERERPHLRGWRDSRPVRVGNGAGGHGNR